MRVLTTLGLVLVGGASALHAQRTHQVEFGAFGSYTRYDRVFQLDNQFGGGGRIGFFFNDYIGLEVDANIAYPFPKAGGAHTQMRFGSASLVINGGGQGNVLYVLGGYSRLDMGVNPPYNFALHAVHGALGDRLFLFNRLAIRLEARAYYAPKNCCLTQQWVGHVTGSAGISLFLGGKGAPSGPKLTPAQRDSILAAGGKIPEQPGRGPSYERRNTGWAHQWYWGAQGGILVFNSDPDGFSAEPMFGGHWLITGGKTALYLAFEQAFFLSDRHATIVEPDGSVNPGNVAFHDLRRIMVGILAFPAQQRVEPFGGGGFAIMEILNPVATCLSCVNASERASVQDAADNAATKAFFFWMGGVDIKQGRLGLYGHYILTSAAKGFLIQGTTHTFQGGIRYILGSAKESITESH